MTFFWRTLPVALGLAAGGGAAEAADPLSTGKAIYDIEFISSGLAAGEGSKGQMMVSLERDCRAYRTETTMNVDIPMFVGTAKLALEGWMVEEGDALEFDVNTKMGGMTVEDSAGTARRTADGVAVDLTRPRATSLTHTGPVLFPIAMIEAAVAAAQGGATFADYKVFDGSGGGREVWSLSVVITPVDPSEDVGEETLFASGLGYDGMKRWRMKFSYFPPGAGGEQTPAFSTEAIVYENGFTLAATYQLPGLDLKLELVEFTPIPPKPC